MTDLNNESKLPRWAQTALFVLRQQVARLEAEVQAGMAGRETSVSYDDGLMGAIRYLPDRACVTFSFGKRQRVRVMKLTRDGVETLDVNGDRSILLHPRASNSVYVTLVE